MKPEELKAAIAAADWSEPVYRETAELLATLWQQAVEVRDFYIGIGLEEHGAPSVPASIHEMVLTLAKLDACP